ncbi:MAG: tetratricopeptide repeat protein [Chloroflexota bacterium]
MAAEKNTRQAVKENKAGLDYFENWDIDNAIAAFKEATQHDPDNPEYHLNLARAYARSSDYHHTMESLGEFIRTESNPDIVDRYERLFSSALDEVETVLIETMRKEEMPVQQIGKAIQMWLEYRITMGRQPMPEVKPTLWAAALAYAITKVNFTEVERSAIAKAFRVTEKALKAQYESLINTLDLMPADYRYFVGEENPLDKLVEAAQLLEELDAKFRDEA